MYLYGVHAMTILPLKDADHTLVYERYVPGLGYTLYCKDHGAMNKLTASGIWRCLSTYAAREVGTGDVVKSKCRAGCQYGEALSTT